MQNAANSSEPGWWKPALALVGAVTVLRLIALAFNRTDLFVDESQYWFWGQHLSLGYYSKPPLIGWVIRLVTELAGSNAPFWVRFPAPVFHGVTAMILAAIAQRYRGRRAALWVAAGYVTLPMVAVGSLLISTDTIMFPFIATALLLWLRLAEHAGAPEGEDRPGREAAMALGAGFALGLGFLAKYAALYFLLSAALAALLVPRLRPSLRAGGLAALAFAATIWPNVIWNAATGFPTLAATATNIGWVEAPSSDAGMHWGELASFFGAQFAVMGPIAFALLLWRVARVRAMDGVGRVLVTFAVPPVVAVCIEAFLSSAYANWAVAAYLGGTILVFAEGNRLLRAAAIALNLVIAVALPLATIWPTAVTLPNGQYLLSRYLGRTAASNWIIGEARMEGLSIVVARDRDVLADLFYTGRHTDLDFYAVPARGQAKDQYQLTRALPVDSTGDVLFVTTDAGASCAKGRKPLATYQPTSGAYRGRTFNAYKVPAKCWAGGAG